MTAISRTLLHSLWQGALLAALTGMVMTCTRKTSSASRYNLLVAAMALFAFAVAGTFIMEWNMGSVSTLVTGDHALVDHDLAQAGAGIYPAGATAAITGIIGAYLNSYAGTIVWIWFSIMFARCLQLAIGLRGLYNLRHKNVFGIGIYWEERLQQLSTQLGIKRLACIVQSGQIKAPVVIGYLKPLILVPIGILASLSAEEAEAILLHELAHIRRADYLVNLLQSLLEIVFFFNPSVLWLSALIKAERENCCDDMVLVRSTKVNYLNALVACAEYNQPSPAYAMSLKGSYGELKNRVSRIVSNKNLSLNSRERSLLAAFLIATIIFATAFVNGEKLNKLTVVTKKTTTEARSRHHEAQPIEVMISDLMEDGIITSANDLSFKISSNEFIVNYKKQPEEIFQKYRLKYIADQQDGERDWFYHYDNSKVH